MAIDQDTLWEVQVGGSDANGGGFSSAVSGAGTDYSQQATAQLSVTDAACTGNTTLTSATGGFTAAMVGNLVYLSSGPGWYQITAYTDTNTVTIDRNGPNATGITANIGGALGTPGALSTVPIADHNRCWIKAGTYTNTTTTAGSAGPISISNKFVVIRGYDVTRGDDTGTRPILHAGATSPSAVATLSCTNSLSYFENIKIVGNGNAVKGFVQDKTQRPCRNCVVDDCTSWAFDATAFRCTVESGTSGFLRGGYYCFAKDCTTRGFYGYQNGYTHCIAKDCTKGWESGTEGTGLQHCVFDGCTSGVYCDNNVRSARVDKCIFRDCTTAISALYNNSNHRRMEVVDAAFWGNTSQRTTGYTWGREENLINLAADPFVGADDYTLTAAAATELADTWQDESWPIQIGATQAAAGGGGLSGLPLGRAIQ